MPADNVAPTPSAPRAILRVLSEGQVRVSEIREFLGAIEDAYNGIVAFENLIENLRRYAPGFEPYFYRRRPFLSVLWLPTGKRKRGAKLVEGISPESLVKASDRLVLMHVQLSSPGSWDFLGKLSPLEVIRQWVADSHERRKDREYREAAEKERLALENKLLENRFISERIAIARNLGASEDDLAPVLNDLIFKPLMEISQQQNKGLIEGVEVKEVDESKL